MKDLLRQLLDDLTTLDGVGLSISELDGTSRAHGFEAGVVRLGIDRAGGLPPEGLNDFDILLSADRTAAAPWVGVGPEHLDAAVERLAAAVAAQPVAAAVAAQVLRSTLSLNFDQALILESLAYSMLLASDAFATWRAATPVRCRKDDTEPRVLVETLGATLEIRLNRPAARNAFDAQMREELVEALTFALEHPDSPPVILSGVGPVFSAGGDLNEFGQASDAAVAHLIRVLRAPARLAFRLGERLTVRVHGSCVGAGIEVPAAASRVIAGTGAMFRLPEVSMGLIPGAGGTATISRRVGRCRACYMVISGAEIDLPTALAWGLVDAAA